jgi:hypothetical protein
VEIPMKSKINFIENDEKIQSELYLRETYVCKTQKRLYVSKSKKGGRKTEKIVNLNTVQAVSLEEGREKRSSGPLLMGLLVAGCSVFFAFKENLKPVFLSLLFVGLMLTLIGIIVKLPRYYSKLIISSYGHPIELQFEKITGSKEEKLKEIIYSTLVYTDPNPQEVESEPVYDETGDENLTQIPEIIPVVEAPIEAEENTEGEKEPEMQEA